MSKEDKNAFTELYRRFRGRVYAFAYRMLLSREKANDIFQEVFLRVYEYRNKTLPDNVGGYIIRVTRNLCLNHLRQKNKYEVVELEDWHLVLTESDYENKELSEIIFKALELLPTSYREVFVLKEYDGLTHQEIAEITEQSVASVKVQFFRAKTKLRKILEPYWKIHKNNG